MWTTDLGQTQMTHFTATDEPKGPYRWVVLCGVWLIYFSFGLTAAALGPLVTLDNRRPKYDFW